MKGSRSSTEAFWWWWQDQHQFSSCPISVGISTNDSPTLGVLVVYSAASPVRSCKIRNTMTLPVLLYAQLSVLIDVLLYILRYELFLLSG